MRNIQTTAFLIISAAALSPTLQAEPPVAELLRLHTAEAASYRIYRDETHKDLLELRDKPIFNWTNQAAEETQYGHLFLWLKNGRPEVIGTIFSARLADARGKRQIIHEFHTLATQRLFPVTPKASAFQWKPEKGIPLIAVTAAADVAENAPQRLAQMRAVARTYSAETRHREGKVWQLRLLTTPLFRYDPTGSDVLDGALFAMVSSEGTDPELVIVVEARHAGPKDPTWVWQTAAVRFTDKDLSVNREGKPMWSSLTDPSYKAAINENYTLIETRDKTYSCYRARIIDELADAKE